LSGPNNALDILGAAACKIDSWYQSPNINAAVQDTIRQASQNLPTICDVASWYSNNQVVAPKVSQSNKAAVQDTIRTAKQNWPIACELASWFTSNPKSLLDVPAPSSADSIRQAMWNFPALGKVSDDAAKAWYEEHPSPLLGGNTAVKAVEKAKNSTASQQAPGKSNASKNQNGAPDKDKNANAQGSETSDYKSHYKNSAIPKQINININNLMNVDSIDLTKGDNVAIIEKVKQEVAYALYEAAADGTMMLNNLTN
jgi:hypothetical protein